MGRKKEWIEASPEKEAKARDFLEWFALERAKINYYVRGCCEYDEDLMSDAMLRVYDAISRKGTDLEDYLCYFLHAYKNTVLDSKKVKAYNIRIEEVRDLAAPDFDSDTYEEAVETINSEVLEYVRENYDEVAVSLFEIYVGLSPDISYKRMSKMLGIPASRIWPVIGKIKKDLAGRFAGRLDFLLSGVVGF